MKQIKVKVIPNAKKNRIVQEREVFKVYVNAPAVEGKANKALIEILADYFQVRKSSIKIIRGEKAREKVIELNISSQSVKGRA